MITKNVMVLLAVIMQVSVLSEEMDKYVHEKMPLIRGERMKTY